MSKNNKPVIPCCPECHCITPKLDLHLFFKTREKRYECCGKKFKLGEPLKFSKIKTKPIKFKYKKFEDFYIFKH